MLGNQILWQGNVIQSEILSYLVFQKSYGKNVTFRVSRVLGMLVEQFRRKAESYGGKLVNLHAGR